MSPTGPSTPNGDAATAGAARAELAFQLRGTLPCVRCGYDLGGLSIRGVCPECGTPIRATLLVVVDPHARELQPVKHSALVVTGLLAWSIGALGAALLEWWLRVGTLSGLELSTGWVRRSAMACAVISGLGALALVRPHARIAPRDIAAAALGVAGYVPLVVLSAWIWTRFGVMSAAPAVAGVAPPVEGTLARLAQAAVLAMMIVCLRPNARLLAARSLLLRSGRVDRQTMFAMAAAVGVVALGHMANLIASRLQGRALDVTLGAGTVLVAVGWMLVTIGLIGVVVDIVRLCPVLREPAPTLRALLARSPEARGVRP
jgi:hypothetical protein